MGSRRSLRASREIRYQDDDDIEIVGDTEMDKKNAAKIDKNFGKMTMKAKLQAMESFRNSSQFDENEEQEVVMKTKSTRSKSKKEQVVEDDDSDIEVLDSDSDAKKGDSDDEIEVLKETSDEKQKTKTNSIRKRASSVNEKLLQEDFEKPIKTKSDESKSGDYIQVKSASGKTMMVERSKLAALMAREGTSVSKVQAQVPEEILLAEDSEEEEGLVEPRVSKRLQEVRGGPSKRPRRHLG